MRQRPGPILKLNTRHLPRSESYYGSFLIIIILPPVPDIPALRIFQEGLPTVRYFAEKICLSQNYFGDLIKKETGKTAQENIQDRIISLAKEWIVGTNKTVSQIAYDLGFQYSQHFSRIFKKTVGCTPNEYRKSQMS